VIMVQLTMIVGLRKVTLRPRRNPRRLQPTTGALPFDLGQPGRGFPVGQVDAEGDHHGHACQARAPQQPGRGIEGRAQAPEGQEGVNALGRCRAQRHASVRVVEGRHR
jgi:hypothetical protein